MGRYVEHCIREADYPEKGAYERSETIMDR